jgi:putative phosphoribosyl transferase
MYQTGTTLEFCLTRKVFVVEGRTQIMSQAARAINDTREVRISSGDVTLSGELNIPRNASGVVLFAHGSGSSRHSPRNRHVARTIRNAGVGTLLFDLLTRDEEVIDAHTRHLRFGIGLLADRLVNATYWLKGEFDHVRAGYFGASTGAAAALVAAAQLGEIVGAVVSRGGRPDLAADSLPLVKAPTLLIIGGLDTRVIEMNRQAYMRLHCEKEIEIVPGATHLFEEPGTLDQVAQLAAEWFRTHLHSSRRSAKNGEITDEYVAVKR